ncbi:hypothetical protein niasHS_002320 [Heterodera schachtii]|uniref:N-acetyltransferase domain-containing protein n=1 Tax=Heterodera schachtii TaxID=97005 RepID=A0ABD2KL23_HETSC
MRINANDSVIGHHCVLVPYCPKHVEKYHGWMASEELRRETFSEALTLEEEQQMQRAWREDGDKLTFIILDKRTMAANGGEDEEIASMVGDINAFLCSYDSSIDGKDEETIGGGTNDDISQQRNDCGGESDGDKRCFELSVMVAEPGFRRRGIALEACKLMIAYILQRIGGKPNFIAKISAKNHPSLALFRDRLNFTECAFSEVFDLTTLFLENERAKELVEQIQLLIEPYESCD